MLNGFIKIYRSIMDWEWYEDSTVFKFFITLILLANHKEKKFKGVKVPRGALITSIDSLVRATKLSKNTVTRCLEKLSSSGDISEEIIPNKCRIIHISNYDKYQTSGPNLSVGQNLTNSRSKIDQQGGQNLTNCRVNSRVNSRGTNKNIKEVCVPTGTHTQRMDKKAASPAARPERRGLTAEEITYAMIKAVQTPGGDDYIAGDFFNAFKKSRTCFPQNWETLYKQFAAAEPEKQKQFIQNVKSGMYREKWGGYGNDGA